MVDMEYTPAGIMLYGSIPEQEASVSKFRKLKRDKFTVQPTSTAHPLYRLSASYFARSVLTREYCTVVNASSCVSKTLGTLLDRGQYNIVPPGGGRRIVPPPGTY